MTFKSFITGIGEKIKQTAMAGAKAYLPALLGERSTGNMVRDTFGQELAQISYEDPNKRPQTFRGATLQPTLSADPNRISVYEDPNKKQVYVSFRGTVPTNLQDLKSDVRVATGLGRSNDPYLKDAERTIEAIKRTYPDNKIIASGHSLGGYVAREVSKKYGDIQGYGYNVGSGLPELLGGGNPLNFASYRQQGDIVSAFDKPSNTGGVFNTSIAGAHSLNTFLR